MLTLTATRAPRGPNDPPPSVVVLTSSWSGSENQCETCVHAERLSLAATSRSLGIPVVAIGRNEPEVDIAARTGGAAVIVLDAAQYPIALSRLDSIVGRVIGFNRVRVALDSRSNVFRSGHTVWTYMSIRIGPDTEIWFPLAFPI